MNMGRLMHWTCRHGAGCPRSAGTLGVLVCMFSLAMLGGCQLRPLVDPEYNTYVRIKVNTDNIRNVTTGIYNEDVAVPEIAPEVMHVLFYEPDGNSLVAESFVSESSSDGDGYTWISGYLSLVPGDYRMLAYNFGTESTLIRDGHLYDGIQAYTNEISGTLRSSLSSRANGDNERIVYVPDHLFTDRNEELSTSYGSDIDTLRNADGDHFTAGSIVLSYYLQIRVKGIDWISSAVGLLTGMAGSATLNDGQIRMEDPVTVYFEMQRGPSAANEGFIYTTFHTFGKLPDASNELAITFDVRTTDGRALTTTLDITDKFSEPDAIDHQWILLDEVLNIPEPPEGSDGGGFVPGVDDWEDIETDIII